MTRSTLSQNIIHDAADESFRSPLGAIRTGESLTLAFSDPAGEVLDAELELYGDEYTRSFELGFEGGRWFVTLAAPEAPAALWYRFTLHTREGELYLCAGEGGRFGELAASPGEGFRLTVFDKDFTTPEWFQRTVMYQIFPDRFSRDESDTARRGAQYHRSMGRAIKYHESWDESVDWLPNTAEGFYFPSDFYGGTLRGIEGRLPYLKSLGVGCIYLNPVFEACSNHRYDTADYLRVDPILGTNEDLESLCRTARELGLRIMLDGVFSHTGADSVYFDKFSRYSGDGAYQGEASPYFKWFDFREFPDKYRCWWNFEDLPEVDEQNKSWQEYVVTGENSVIKRWLRAGISGWRLDVADELPDEVLSLIRDAAKEVSKEAVILGEVWEDPIIKTSYGKRRDYALGASLESVMNYPLRRAVIDFFTLRADSRALAEALLSQRLNYPAPLYYSLMNLLSSHDVERIRTALASRLDARSLSREQQAGFIVSDAQDERGEKMQRLASAVQFCIPGVPCLYYGDETGMGGMADPFNRAPFTVGARPLTDWYARLGALRNAHPALSTGAVSFFAPDADILCVLRFDERDAFLLCVNRAGEERSAAADLWLSNAGLTATELEAFKAKAITSGEDALTGERMTVTDGLTRLTLPPETARIYRLG